MSYVDNAPLITAWDTRVQALKDIIATLYDGSSTKVVIENTSSNVLLSALSPDSVGSPSGVMTLGNPELVSNEQAPGITIETPTLILNPEEGSEEETTEESVEDPSDQEEEKEDTVDETVEEPSEETEEEEEITSEDTEE